VCAVYQAKKNNIFMINIKDYEAKKAKSLVSIVKAGNSFAVATKKYSAEDGSPLPDEVIGVSIDELNEQKATLQAQIDDIDSFIADCEAAEEN
jgi:hypothetical protein